MQRNYYGFDHEAVNKAFPGGLTYITDFCINGEYHPVAVYRVANPDRSKGHKDYLLLNKGYVRGMNEEEIQSWRFQDALRCEGCQDVVYSVMRHDDRFCECGNVSIDGGREYTKVGIHSDKEITMGQIDHLTGEFTPNESR